MRIAALALLVMTHAAWADEPAPTAPTPADPTTPAPEAPANEPARAPAPAPSPASTAVPSPSDAAQQVELKPKAAHVLGEIPKPTQGKYAVRQRADVSHVPAYVATGVTVGLVLATALSYKHHEHLVDAIDSEQIAGGGSMIDEELARRQGRIDRADRWHSIWLGSAALTVIAGGATGFLWSRHETQPDGPVDPANPAIRIPMTAPFFTRPAGRGASIEAGPRSVRVGYTREF